MPWEMLKIYSKSNFIRKILSYLKESWQVGNEISLLKNLNLVNNYAR